MPKLILDDEQAKVVTSSLKPIEVLDRKGNCLGVIPPVWTEEDIAEAKKRLASDEPRYTTAQVLAHLRSLEQK